MSGYSVALQTAVYGLLNGISPPIAAGGVYDHVPQNVAYPFIEIGESQVIPDDTSKDSGGDSGVSEFIDLHVWSRANQSGGARGQKEAKGVVDQIHTLLHGVSLSVSGRASALCWIRTVRMMRDPDGLTVHAIVTVECIHRS